MRNNPGVIRFATFAFFIVAYVVAYWWSYPVWFITAISIPAMLALGVIANHLYNEYIISKKSNPREGLLLGLLIAASVVLFIVAQPREATRKIEILKIIHYRAAPHPESRGVPEAEPQGSLDDGLDPLPVQFSDYVSVFVKLNAPSYCYLIAFNPDGSIQLCFPEDENRAPPLVQEIEYPSPAPESRHRRLFPLTDGVGVQLFVVLASHIRLPKFSEWRARNGSLSWQPPKDLKGIWRVEGRGRVNPRVIPVTTKRGSPMEAPLATQPIEDFCRALRERAGADDIEALVFPILPAETRADATAPAGRPPEIP